MLLRELAPGIHSDPCLLKLRSADDSFDYYFDYVDMLVYREPPRFQDVPGGILAEEMGTGKTCIVLALIMASRDIYARPPPLSTVSTGISLHQPDSGPASLLTMCANAIVRNNVTWRPYHSVLPQACLRAIREAPARIYEIPPRTSMRIQRASVMKNAVKRPGEPMILSNSTLVVVPDTLVVQWRNEISKHCVTTTNSPECDDSAYGLKTLVITDCKRPIPPVAELLRTELVLMSYSRFAKEEADGGLQFMGVPLSCNCPYIGSTRVRNCTCPPSKYEAYQSPLMRVHWKRLCIDEGHSMSRAGSNATQIACKLRVDCRWCCTGTPTRGLVGMAVGMEDGSRVPAKGADERGDLERLGTIVKRFLKAPPFAGDERYWTQRVVLPFRARMPGIMEVIRRIMHRLMVRNLPRSIESEIELPPLYTTVVYVPQSYQNKLTECIFRASIVTNAVTSERRDQDYLFHANNSHHLRNLLNNITHSTFWWTGWTVDGASGLISVARNALDKATQGSLILSPTDRYDLEMSIYWVERALKDMCWRECSVSHEMGYVVDNMLPDIAPLWNLDGQSDSVVYGGSALVELQRLVHAKVSSEPVDLHVSCLLRESFAWKAARAKRAEAAQGGAKRRDKSASSIPRGKTLRRNANKTETVTLVEQSGLDLAGNDEPKKPGGPARSRNASATSDGIDRLDEASPLSGAELCGTGSAKLNYLLSQILQYQHDEKIIVFCEHDDSMFYLSEALDILGVAYLIYTAAGLTPARRSQYLVTFNQTDTFRVLIMNLNYASHGLNVCSASRVYFVHPVWQRNIEAQAIKRAHRIGQTRPVYAEILVLEDSIEAKTLERRLRMSEEELLHTRVASDDETMRSEIARATFADAASEKVAEKEQRFGHYRIKVADETFAQAIVPPVALFPRERQNSEQLTKRILQDGSGPKRQRLR